MITLIAINYNNQPATAKCVKSINKCRENLEIEIIIVDNKSTEKSRSDLEAIKIDSGVPVTIIPSEQNSYYWGGAVIALEYLFKKNKLPSVWTVICNNDMQFDHDFFMKLQKKNIKEYPIIAPRIISQINNRDQNPYLEKPMSLLYKIYFRLYILNKWLSKYFYFGATIINKMIIKQQNLRGGNKPKKIYAPHGSCVVLSKYFFDNGGYLDTGFTMYGEEISTAEIARKLNMTITYLPDMIVYHDDHDSTNQFSWSIYFDHVKSTYSHLFKTYPI